MRIISAPKDLINKRLVRGTTIEATIVEIQDPPPFEGYKIATAEMPKYEELELFVPLHGKLGH
jgi:hypothetical protein